MRIFLCHGMRLALRLAATTGCGRNDVRVGLTEIAHEEVQRHA